MKLFRVKNTSGSSWVVANDESEAIRFFFDNTTTREIENVKIIADHSEIMLREIDFPERVETLSKILDDDKVGFA